MGKGIGVPFVADVSGFLAGTGKVEGALDDVIDSLDDVARQGQRTEDVVSRSLTGIGTEATDSSDKMEREFKTAFDQVERDSKASGKRIGTNIDTGLNGVDGKANRKQAAGEIGSEFAQNIGEGISSGKVGVAGALDTVLGTVGGVLPALGPVGAVAGIGALVIGSVIAGLNANAEAAKAKAKEIGSALYDAMQDGVVDATDKESVLEKVLGVDNKAELLRRVQEISDQTGLSVSEVYKQITGESSTTREDINKTITAHTTLVKGGSGGKAGGGARKQIDDIGLGYKDILGYQDSYKTGIADANGLISTQNGLLDETLAKWRAIDTKNRVYANKNAANKVKANADRYLSS